MSAPQPVHNRTTDAVRAAYMAKIANRPLVDPHDLNSAQLIATHCDSWLRNLYRTLDNRPDLLELVKGAGRNLAALRQRLEDEARRTAQAQAGRAH